MKVLIKRLLNFKDESGAAIVIVAISLVAMIGFAAITIDGGRLYLEKSKLQNAMDAAVLAGASQLLLSDPVTSESQATTIAKAISEKNGYTPDNINPEHQNFITATTEIEVPLTFARVLGINSAQVPASAKAIVGPLVSAGGIAPIAVAKSEIPHGTTLNCGNSKHSTGNCGFLRIDGTGAKDLENAIVNGSEYSVGDTTVHTEKGEMKGPVRFAVDELIERDKDRPQCWSASTADNTCSRVIYIAVIDTWEDVNNTVDIIGFAAYWVQEYDHSNNELIGHFLKMVKAGEVGESGSTGEYGVYGVKLAE
ncbi:Flp pilus assembly protein TadG [Mesobacillus persicus]|uniref:Flp pilus assembly protein TadG n=1 Tax=Mesobacillus persicus TaxID=930146 RepID=A0A1H8CGG4_9BACI|nr:TadE/TadG family type IV pilus assembly protein [Mesobacillus persicus]SEM94173.1 Flp pilus assembly protein TadG [Mesobacillus persicus]